MTVVCVLGLVAWSRWSLVRPHSEKLREVRLDLSLWEPETVAGETMGGATDEMTRLLARASRR